jgi:hypothetical protein
MDVTAVPFNQLLGLKRAERDPPYLLELEDRPTYANHLGGVHAVAQLALAEAGSAEYLLRTYREAGPEVVAVVRRVQAKFKKPLQGRAFAKASVAGDEAQRFAKALDAKGMALIRVNVDVAGADDVVATSVVIEWFIRRLKETGSRPAEE